MCLFLYCCCLISPISTEMDYCTFFNKKNRIYHYNSGKISSLSTGMYKIQLFLLTTIVGGGISVKEIFLYFFSHLNCTKSIIGRQVDDDELLKIFNSSFFSNIFNDGNGYIFIKVPNPLKILIDLK